MQLQRRHFAALAGLTASARAAEFPSRPLRLVSPFGPGGAVDVLNRVLAEQLSADLGQPVVVDTRPGANTVAGAEMVARAPPDGHTFMITTNSTHTNNPHIMRELPYDPLRSFAPITLLSWGSVLLLRPATATYDGLRGMIDWARGLRRPITYGSWGIASAGHLYGALLARQAGIAMEHVPYRGEQAAITDLLAGRLDTSFVSPVGARPQIEAGLAQGVGTVGNRRSSGLPGLATFAEQGLDGFDLPLFVAAWAPAGTPGPIVARLRLALVRAVANPVVRERMAEQGQTPELSTPEELMATVRRDLPRWGELIALSGAERM